MALFQVSFLLLPESLFPLNEGELKAYLSDSRPAYRSFCLPQAYAQDVEKILPAQQPWGSDPGMELWGDDKSDDFTVFTDDGIVESIELRLDVRKLDDQLLAEFLGMASAWRCVLVERRHATVCRMSVAQFRAFLAGHAHSRAINSPETWMPFLADEVRKQDSQGRN